MSPLTRCLLLISCWGARLLSLPVHADGPLLNAPGDAGAVRAR